MKSRFFKRLYPLNRFLRLLIVLGGTLTMFGCREYELYHFKEINTQFLKGDLVIEVTPSRDLNEKSGKKTAVESNPYSLRFKYFSTTSYGKIVVSDLKLVGKKTGGEYLFSDVNSLDAALFPESDKYYAIASFSDQLLDKKLSYESYSISATISVIAIDGAIEKAEIEYLLETDFKTDKRSDLIDGVMGI